MNALIEFIINLFRSPASAAEFVADPEEAMRTAGLPPVNPAQLQAIAATAAPAGAVLGGGDPIGGHLRRLCEAVRRLLNGELMETDNGSDRTISLQRIFDLYADAVFTRDDALVGRGGADH